jgi:hypothetical protein
LLARMSRKNCNDLPPELRDLHAHFRQKIAAPEPRPHILATRTLYHVAKDGTRTAFVSKAAREAGQAPGRSQSPGSAGKGVGNGPLRSPQRSPQVPHETPTTRRTLSVKDDKDTALSAAFQAAFAKGGAKKT